MGRISVTSMTHHHRQRVPMGRIRVRHTVTASECSLANLVTHTCSSEVKGHVIHSGLQRNVGSGMWLRWLRNVSLPQEGKPVKNGNRMYNGIMVARVKLNTPILGGICNERKDHEVSHTHKRWPQAVKTQKED